MKRLFATLGIGAALASGAAPATAAGNGDPFSTDCYVIANLAEAVPASALLALSGTTITASADVKIQTHFPPVTLTQTSDGGCQTVVNPS